jgi:hypothetical protein
MSGKRKRLVGKFGVRLVLMLTFLLTLGSGVWADIPSTGLWYNIYSGLWYISEADLNSGDNDLPDGGLTIDRDFTVNMKNHGIGTAETKLNLTFNGGPFGAALGGSAELYTVTISSSGTLTSNLPFTITTVNRLNIIWTAQLQTGETANANQPENFVTVNGTSVL